MASASRQRYYERLPSLQTAHSLNSLHGAVSFRTDPNGSERSILSPPLSMYLVPVDGVPGDSRGDCTIQHTGSRKLTSHSPGDPKSQGPFDPWKSDHGDPLPSLHNRTGDELCRQRSTTVPLAYRPATTHCESKKGVSRLTDRIRHPRKWRKYKEGQRIMEKRRTHNKTLSLEDDDITYSISRRSPYTEGTSRHSDYLTVQETLEKEAARRIEELKAKSYQLSTKSGRLQKGVRAREKDAFKVAGSLCSRVTRRVGDYWKGAIGSTSGSKRERVRLRKVRKEVVLDGCETASSSKDHSAASALDLRPSTMDPGRLTYVAAERQPSQPDYVSEGSTRSVEGSKTAPFGHAKPRPASPLSPGSTPSHTAAQSRSRTKAWAETMYDLENDPWWHQTPSLAGSLHSGREPSRTSTRRADSVISSLESPDNRPSAYEFEAAEETARRHASGNEISRQLSGSTAVNSPCSESWAHAPWPRKTRFRKSGQRSKYVLTDAASITSSGSGGRTSNNDHDFPILNFGAWEEQGMIKELVVSGRGVGRNWAPSTRTVEI